LIIAEGKEVKGFLNLLIFRTVHEVYDARSHKWVEVNSSEEFLSWFQHHPYLKAGKPQPVTVGGVKGVQFDYAVAKDSPEPDPKSWRYSDGLTSNVDTGSYNRGIILDLDVKGDHYRMCDQRVRRVLAQGAEGTRHREVGRLVGTFRVYSPKCVEGEFCELRL
jgi:hypothetical protein